MQTILSKKGDETTCTAAVLMRDGRVLLGLRHYTPDKWKTVSVWTTPGGRCDAGEVIEEVLRREIAEETGITDVSISKHLGTVSGAKEGDTVEVFLCETADECRLMEPHKFSEWRWFNTDDIPDNFINPAVLALIV